MLKREQFKELTLADKAIIEKYTTASCYPAQTFVELASFAPVLKSKFAEYAGYLCLYGTKQHGECECNFPVAPLEDQNLQEVVDGLFDCFSRDGKLVLTYTPESMLHRVADLQGYKVSWDYDLDDSDYLYLTEEFLNLSGRVNRKKRYDLDKFSKEYEGRYEYKVLTPQNVSLCNEVIDGWCDGRDCALCLFGCEKKTTNKVVEIFPQVDALGGVVMVEGKPASFIIGARMPCKCGCGAINFHKETRPITGLSIFTFMEFVKRNFADLLHVNLEEDIGLEGLRRFKRKMNPCDQLHKYSVTLIKRT